MEDSIGTQDDPRRSTGARRSAPASTDAKVQGRPSRHRRRGAVMLGSVALLSLLAVIGGWQLLGESREDAGERVVTLQSPTSQLDRAATLPPPAQAVAALLKGDGPIRDRAATVTAPPSGPSPTALASAVEELVHAGSGDDPELDVRARWQDGDMAVVDVGVRLAGAAVGLAGNAELASFVLVRDDGVWRLTAESVCGLLSMAPMVGLEPACEAPPGLHRSDRVPDVEELLAPDPGEPIGEQVRVGTWGETIERTGSLVWFVDYPELQAGGGGPVGPAEVVAVDLVSGARVGAHRLEGTEALLAASSGTSVWALHSVPGSDGPMGRRLARVDAISGVVSDVPTGAATTALRSSGDALWLLEAGDVTLRRDGVEVARVRTGTLIEPWRVAATSSELWVGRARGSTLVIDAEDGSTREVSTPPDDLLAGSADQIWSIDAGPGPTLRRLGADGAVIAETPLPGHVSLAPAGSAEHQVWGDGAGGIWLVGTATPEGHRPAPAGEAGSIHSPVVQRPIAIRVGADGEPRRTWWASGSAGRTEWFRPVGDVVGLFDGDGLRMLTG